MQKPITATRSAPNAAPRNGFGEQDVGALVIAKLRGSSYLLVRDIACEYHDGVLTLRGRLPSYYLKQVTLSLVREVEHVGRVHDLIEVVTPGGRPA